MNLKYSIFSECGRREKNQDRISLLLGPLSSLFVLCDGMGGCRYGDKAAETVSKGLTRYWQRTVGWPDSEQKVHEACRKVAGRLKVRAQGLGGARMGTTMVMAAFMGRSLTIANSGDSRCYLMRPGCGKVFCTEDHLMQGLDNGPLTRAFFSYGPDRYQPDVHRFECLPGDTVFLCSDGVHRYLSAGKLHDLLLDGGTTEDIVSHIVRLCHDCSHDNFSGVCIRVLD